MNLNRQFILGAVASVALAGAGGASAAPVLFSNADATFSQAGFPVSMAIDGNTNNQQGWPIDRPGTFSETALFTLATPLAGSNALTFTLYQNYGSEHTLGDFSLAYTTVAAPTLLSAMTALSLTASSLNGATFTYPGGRILAGGVSPLTDVYTLTGSVSPASAITGIFLNVYQTAGNGHATDGPGRQSFNGNFVLTEITLDATASQAVPEPATWAMMVLGFGGLGSMIGRSRRRLLPARI